MLTHRRSTALTLTALTAFGFLLLPARPVQAQSGVITISNFVLAAPGGTGSFDVLLTALAPPTIPGLSSSLSVGSFTVEPTISGTGVTFTAADFSTTTPYIFPDSFDQDNGLTLSDETDAPLPNTDLIASDSDNQSNSAVTIDNGTTVGLAHITYQFDAADTPGTTYMVTFNSDGTSLSDGTGTVSYPVMSLPGVLTVSPVAAPEPSGAACFVVAGVLILGLRGRTYLRERRSLTDCF